MINQPPAARPVPRFALFAVDFAVTAVTLVAGPPLAVSMIKLPFGGRAARVLTAAAEMSYPAVDFFKPSNWRRFARWLRR